MLRAIANWSGCSLTLYLIPNVIDVMVAESPCKIRKI